MKKVWIFMHLAERSQYDRPIPMDRTWMKASPIRDVYENGVEEFLQFAQQNAPVMGGKYFCSCVKYVNGR